MGVPKHGADFDVRVGLPQNTLLFDEDAVHLETEERGF